MDDWNKVLPPFLPVLHPDGSSRKTRSSLYYIPAFTYVILQLVLVSYPGPTPPPKRRQFLPLPSGLWTREVGPENVTLLSYPFSPSTFFVGIGRVLGGY